VHGSLALTKGIVYVGRCAKTAWVATFDVDGQRLEGGFEFRDDEAGRSSVSGLAVDEDHRVWVADGAGGRVRAFTLFGRPLVDVVDEGAASRDAQGTLGQPADVAVRGCDDDLEVIVASGGARRHALQVFHPATGSVRSLRPEAGPRGLFQDLSGVTWRGDRLFACEAGAGAVRVYQDGALHWSLHLPVAGAGRFRPTGAAVLEDGSLVVSCGDPVASALLHCDPGGRVRRVLAEAGAGEGQVDEPLDVVVDEHVQGGPRAVVIDRAGDRVQVFTLEGRCYGSFPQLTGT
jgi:sugar lactone lactonase YvrE